jgi:redox-sensitive bicupin YhaK (pirin superfamily)
MTDTELTVGTYRREDNTMLTIRRSADRGHIDHGWLNARHSFSFGNYHDPEHMGFRVLRVINEDVIAPGQGFGTHPHRDMEILTYVIEGALEHRDDMGNGSVIRPGDVQWMSAGTGVQHSEFNPSQEDPTHLLQIWILPDRQGRRPDYAEKYFPPEDRRGLLCLVASGDGTDGSLSWGQDVRLYASLLSAGDTVSLDLSPGRHAWVQLVRGSLVINGQTLDAGDGAAISDENQLQIKAGQDSEFLVFDLP